MEKEQTLKSMRSALKSTISRCHDPNNRDYPYYGGRGITVCKRWLDSFESFVEDMGLRPEGLTLERVNNDIGYEPGNCVWASRKAQARNRRVCLSLTYKGETKSLDDWSAATGIPYSTLKARVTRLGYTTEEALTKPVKCGAKLSSKVYTPRKRPDMSNVPRGMESRLTKLRKEHVLEMRRLHTEEGLSYSELSRRFNVSVETASKAVQAEGAYKEVK